MNGWLCITPLSQIRIQEKKFFFVCREMVLIVHGFPNMISALRVRLLCRNLSKANLVNNRKVILSILLPVKQKLWFYIRDLDQLT